MSNPSQAHPFGKGTPGDSDLQRDRISELEAQRTQSRLLESLTSLQAIPRNCSQKEVFNIHLWFCCLLCFKTHHCLPIGLMILVKPIQTASKDASLSASSYFVSSFPLPPFKFEPHFTRRSCLTSETGSNTPVSLSWPRSQ